MHWNTDRLIDTHELIQTITTHHDDNEISAALPTLQQLLDQVIDDLKGLLDCPAKSDASRQKLQKGKSLKLRGLNNDTIWAFICRFRDKNQEVFSLRGLWLSYVVV